jgi:AcrR family transcriptional regulator
MKDMQTEPQTEPTAQDALWQPAGDRDRQRELKRHAVLRAAAQLFNEKGFHATSLDDIAERLKVSKPTVYYYVRNKDEILFECVRIGLKMVEEAASQSGDPASSALERLKAAMRKYAEVVTMDFGMCVIRVGEDPLDAASRRQLRKLKAGIDSEFRLLIEQGVAEGSLAPCDPKMAAFMVAGALSWVGRWYKPDGDLSPQQIADQGIALLLRGLLQREPA